VDLVDDDDLALGGDAELVLGVGEDEAALGGAGLPEREQPLGDRRGALELVGGDLPHRQELVLADGDVVAALGGLGRRREQRARQRLVLAQPVGQRVAREGAGAALVGLPDRRRGHAGQVRAHHQLDGERAHFATDAHVGIGAVDDVVRREVRGGAEPVLRELVQHLALPRDEADHAIERAQAIGHDDHALAARRVDVAVAHLAVVADQRTAPGHGRPPGVFEGVSELGVESGVEVHDDS
jgi:hypothetical protein